jgi:hypothetical protein
MSSILCFTPIPDRWVFTHVSDPDLVPMGKHRVWSFPVSGFCSIQDDKEFFYKQKHLMNFTGWWIIPTESWGRNSSVQPSPAHSTGSFRRNSQGVVTGDFEKYLSRNIVKYNPLFTFGLRNRQIASSDLDLIIGKVRLKYRKRILCSSALAETYYYLLTCPRIKG